MFPESLVHWNCGEYFLSSHPLHLQPLSFADLREIQSTSSDGVADDLILSREPFIVDELWLVIRGGLQKANLHPLGDGPAASETLSRCHTSNVVETLQQL